MKNVSKDSYRDKSFSTETSEYEFITHFNIEDLMSKYGENKEVIIKFRTVGIIESIDGRFYIKDLTSSGNAHATSVLVSMAYMNAPVQNSILPHTVQLFGTIQWKGRPVIYASLIQVLSTANALRLYDTIATITKNHLANR